MRNSQPGGRRRIVVTRNLPAGVSDRLRTNYECWINPDDRTLAAHEIQDQAAAIKAEALLVMAMDRIDDGFVERLPDSVRVIATLSLGHEHIDLEAARRRGVAVICAPDMSSETVADMAMLLLLGAARRAHEGSMMLYGGDWAGWSPTQLLGRDVTGARLGIFGMGRIGGAIARKARRGFDMELHYHNRTRLPEERAEGAIYHPSVEGLLAECDFLVLAAPSTPATRGFLDADALARLPQGAIVVNIARGNLVDDDALIAALQSGHVASAGLDVFNNEPAIDPRYLTLPNVFLQPHQGSSTLATRVRMANALINGIEQCLNGDPSCSRLV